MNLKKQLACLALCGLLLGQPEKAAAMDELSLSVSQSLVFAADGVTNIAIADPAIADVVVISDQEFLIIGKKGGATMLHVWQWGERSSYRVLVNASQPDEARMIQEAIGQPLVKVHVAGGKTILEGTVPDQYAKDRAEKIATAFGGEVINLIEMSSPRQVKIESRVIEISSDKAKNLGISYGNNVSTEDDTVTFGQSGVFGLGQSHGNRYDPHPLKWFGTYAEVNAQLRALVEKGEAKILSQPYIITLSGEKAEILIGGEIPVPVNSDDNVVTVEWREYGIKLGIEPTVQNDGGIDSKIKTEISSIDWSTAVSANGNNGTNIPGLKSRKAETHVRMLPGMTMAIGGLISSEESKSISKIPLLGDIPILGQFFRNTSKTRERKEIIILLTPLIVGSDYVPTMSDETKRLSALTDKEVLNGDVLNTDAEKEKKRQEKAEKKAEKQKAKAAKAESSAESDDSGEGQPFRSRLADRQYWENK